MKQRIYGLVGIILATILLVCGAWAIKAGKFAGLADVIKQGGPAQINISTKDRSGSPISSVDLYFSSDNANFTHNPDQKTDSSDHYSYIDLAPQDHTLYFYAQKSNYSVEPSLITLAVSPGKSYSKDFTLTAKDSSKGELKGRVTESDTGNPINGAYIYVSNKSTGYSDQDGNYDIINITPGVYTVAATRNDYQRKEFTLSLIHISEPTRPY